VISWRKYLINALLWNKIDANIIILYNYEIISHYMQIKSLEYEEWKISLTICVDYLIWNEVVINGQNYNRN
jgi:hypothetical protein